MRFKNNKGITLIALTVTIVVLIIITGITFYSGSRLIQSAKYEDVKTNMLLVQAEMKTIIEQAKFESKTIDDLKNDDTVIEGKAVQLQEQVIDGTPYYKIIKPSMSELNLGTLEPEYYYLKINISENNFDVDVYFVPGITNNEGQEQHLLSEMK